MVKNKILVVDDEEFNLDILAYYLTGNDYEVIAVNDAIKTMEILEKNPDINIILLDRMMPNIDGMEVLNRIKSNEKFKNIPVIMQTAAAGSEQALQGIQAGAFYYLTKPYDELTLLRIIGAALVDSEARNEFKSEMYQHQNMFRLMEYSRFRFRTLEETKYLSNFIAKFFPDPEKMICGIREILVNAVEHGNLGITYDEKKDLLLNENWRAEVERRLELPENKNKFAYLLFEEVDDGINLHVKDQGKGFDWEKYLDISFDRINDPNGRGIATAKVMSFDIIKYIGCGNEVICTAFLSK